MQHKAFSIATKFLLCSLPVVGIGGILDVTLYLGKPLFPGQYLALFLTFTLAAVFLCRRAKKGAPADRVPGYDIVFAALSLIVGGYVVLFYPDIIYTVATITPLRLILGFIAILLVLEAVRRTTGWALVVIAIAFILYARYTYLFPGMLYGPGLSWQRLLVFLYLDSNALLGVALKVTVMLVLAFILFGAVLFATGGGAFLTNFAMSAMGRYRGGPAKIAVVASSLFGMMSGSAVANVATTGVITIPMMKKTGFEPHFAGAVEAVASTGGVIMPPIMGAAAFLMAEFLAIPYYQVAIAAAIPAILYYIGAFAGVHLEAVKMGLKGLDRRELPSLKRTLSRGWIFIIPVIVLIYTLFVLYMEPAKAGLCATASVLLVSLFRKETRPNLSKLVAMFEDTGRTMLELTAICATVGFVIGVVGVTGLGLAFSQMLVHVSGGNLLLLLVLAAIGAVIMGMGMPITATYILMVILVAPALIKIGIAPLVAHFFVLYFANLSFLTPPVCLAVYAASSIAGAKPLPTAAAAMRLGISAYIVPFVFVFYPVLLLIGPLKDVVLPVITAILAMVIFQAGLSGYFFSSLHLPVRILLLFAAIGLVIPGWLSDVIGLSLAAVLLLIEWRLHRAKGARAGDSSVTRNTKPFL